jgi:hypothetical protein
MRGERIAIAAGALIGGFYAVNGLASARDTRIRVRLRADSSAGAAASHSWSHPARPLPARTAPAGTTDASQRREPDHARFLER